ncbi:unnamed protein product [Gordionus sp. m RMFG-2023]
MGKCVPKKTIKAKAGSWGQWTTSPCRGDNLIGFRERVRKCDKPRPKFSGKYCPGDKIEYKVCRNKASRNDKSNTALCKGHDPSSIYKTHDDYPCDLICSNEGEYTIYGKVADGTLIKTENTLDMCLKGVKTPIGCDDEFFSTAKRDKCGICNGDNSTCVPFETEEEIILTKARTNITNLKKGTTFLLFRLTLGYYEGFDGVGNSIVLIRNEKNYKGNSIKKLTDITYEINDQYEIISSEKLASPLTIQIAQIFGTSGDLEAWILKNLDDNIGVTYKLRYATPK